MAQYQAPALLLYRGQLPAGAKKTAAERVVKAKVAELPLSFEQNQGQEAGKVNKAATATISANYGGMSKPATLKLKK